jgi:hypothetical protein
MPPKRTRAAVGGAKAKAKAKALAIGAAAAPVPLALVAVGAEVLETEAAQKRRRLERRDTEDKIERAIASRLGNFSVEVVNGTVNSKGEHVREYLANAIRANRGCGKHLSVKFWTGFFQSFNFIVEDNVGLPAPVNEEDIDSALVRALASAHHANPANRSVEPFERLMETMQEPNYTEFFGMVQASFESPSMNKASSLRMKTSILRLVARSGECWGRLAG